MDALKRSAVAFERLLKYEYKIVAGSKQTLLELVLYFSKEHFMHLIGLHKLTDLQLQRYSKEKLYDMIMNDELTYEYLQKSEFFPEIEDRIELFPLLETVLDSNDLMIKYKRGFSKGTLISATYIIVYEHEGEILHYFVDQAVDTGKYFGRSFFSRKDNKFLKNQQTFKVLKKYKDDKVTGNSLTLCDKMIKQ